MESRKVGEKTKFTQESQTKGVDLKLGEELRETDRQTDRQTDRKKKEEESLNKYLYS